MSDVIHIDLEALSSLKDQMKDLQDCSGLTSTINQMDSVIGSCQGDTKNSLHMICENLQSIVTELQTLIGHTADILNNSYGTYVETDEDISNKIS